MSADAKLKSYIDRILRCREAEDLAKDDTKAVYAELAGDGYEKSVVGQVVTFLRKREKDGDKLTEQSAKFDLYLEAYERPSHAHTRVRQPNEGESYERDSQQHVGRTDDEQHDEAPVPGSDGRGEGADAGAEGQGSGTSGSDRSGGPVAGTVDREDEDGRSRHVGGEARHEITPSAASHAANAGGDDVDRSGSPATHLVTGEGTAHSALPDNVTMEYVPPVPMKRLPFAHCFPELSKAEYDRLEKGIAANRVREPIIRQGDVIVDGWNRYTIARKYGFAYPVKELHPGRDVLLDVIEWQRTSRDFTPARERKIAADLAKEFPRRADEIMTAFDLVEAMEAAE